MRRSVQAVEQLAIEVLNGDLERFDALRQETRNLLDRYDLVYQLHRMVDRDDVAPIELAARALSLTLHLRDDG